MDKLLHTARGAVSRDEWPTAWKLLNLVLNEEPDRPEALYLMGHVLRQQGNPGLALPLFAKALSQEQKQPNLWMNYGACLHDLNKWDDAIAAFKIVHAMLPTDPQPMANMGGSLVQQGKWHDAINWADKALAIETENHIAQIARTFGCLGLGRWKEAWKHADYLYGHHLDVRVYNPPEKEEPEWDGSPGKTVVVQCDQGIGDILMFSQCIPMMIRDCKKVIIETVKRLVPLFTRLFPEADVYGTLKQTGMEWVDRYEIDAHIHISHLGKFYLNKDKDFPRKAYIQTDPKMDAAWTPLVEHYPRPWLGIAWKGGIQQTSKHLRSVELEAYAELIESWPGTVFDLSYHDSKREVAVYNLSHQKQVVNPMINADNFEATVSLVGMMDQVVCVTTTVAHLCGAMGRSAHVLVPEVPTWRYAYRVDDGKGLIWYPKDSITLHRRVPGESDWTHCIGRVSKALRS